MSEWKPGDFFHMDWAGGRGEFFVVDVADGFIKFGSSSWCNSGAEWMSEALISRRSPKFICKGIMNYFSLIPFIGDIFPKYTRLWR